MGMFTEWINYPMPLKAWMAFLVLFPFYFFASGQPQIADWILAALIAYELSSQKQQLPRHLTPPLQPLRLFATYVVLVSLIWLPFLGDGKRAYLLTIFPLFYIYNALSFWMALRLYGRYQSYFLRGTLIAITGCVLLQLLLQPVAPSSGTRGTLFFNNPNQLGYFSLLALTILFVMQ